MLSRRGFTVAPVLSVAAAATGGLVPTGAGAQPAVPSSAIEGYVRIGDDTELYYIAAGAGRPVVIVPGWTMTSRLFERQLEHYANSKTTQFIVYDPRAHGRSSKTLEGADYRRHARDLHAFIQALGLKQPIIGGWSWGGVTVYAYLDQFGTNDLSGLVMIDQTPRPLGAGAWLDADVAGVKAFFDALEENRQKAVMDFIPTMFTTNITAGEKSWILSETMMTPKIVASQLLLAGYLSDYRHVLKGLDLPTLHVVREIRGAAARAYLAQAQPGARIAALGAHAMFYDHAPAFNAQLDAFLAEHS